jgi:hypothetical protein
MTNIAKAAADAADARQQALELIRALAARGDSPRYIARALELADIPTSKGGKKWGHTSVEYVAKANGIQLRGYRRVA